MLEKLPDFSWGSGFDEYVLAHIARLIRQVPHGPSPGHLIIERLRAFRFIPRCKRASRLTLSSTTVRGDK